jgi:hypothetical protein
VFDLPSGLVQPGESVQVAYRAWFQPDACFPGSINSIGFEIGESRNLRIANRADQLTALVAIGPALAIHTFIGLLGIGLFVLWCRMRGRELLLCSGFLLANALVTINFEASSLRMLAMPWRLSNLVLIALFLAQMPIILEFTWTVLELRARVLKRVAQAALLVLNTTTLYGSQTTTSSTRVLWLLNAGWFCILVFGQICIWTCLWSVFRRRKSWPIALALTIYPIAATVKSLGFNNSWAIGPFDLSLYDLGVMVASLVLFAMLGQRAWAAWRARDELRVEFEAAREMQEQLVAPAVDVPGFRIESAYTPARQVGGDFFRVIPGADGSVLVVMGDVSGKGLKAAMTVSAIMGALRGCDSRVPAKVLEHLNRVLFGQMNGFVTCGATLIASDGNMTHANSGNPAPYRNGEELEVDPGLPLGILPENSYAETRYQIAPGDQLTFVSDGVVEATNPEGDLYGFERTEAVSNQPAHAIAEAAKRFGQEDDITVLSVTCALGLNPAPA